MDEPTVGSGRTRGVDRLVSFSDGVVAIAATLLVLPLVEIVPEMGAEDIGALLADNTSNFIAFGISFVVIYRFWLTHHRTFGEATALTGPLVWLNGLWLFSIVFLPFPTQLIGAQNVHNRTANGLYIGTMLVTAVCGIVGQWLVLRARRPGARPAELTRSVTPGLVLAASLALALVIAISFPQVGLWALLILFAGGQLSGRLRRGDQSESGH